jgi:hypothetical protein
LLGIQQRCLIDLKAAKESNSQKMLPGCIEQSVSTSYPMIHAFLTEPDSDSVTALFQGLSKTDKPCNIIDTNNKPYRKTEEESHKHQ